AAGRAIETLGPALAVVGRGTKALQGERPGDLRGVVRGLGRALDGLSTSEQQLQDLVDGAVGTLETTAARRADVGRLIEETPRTNLDTQLTMRRFIGTLDRLDPVVAKLRPAARPLDAANRAAIPTLAQLNGLLRDARPLLR